MKKIVFFLFALCLLVLNNQAAEITFSILAPAPVNIPPYIKWLAIVDRSIPEDFDKSQLESILSLEGKNQDQLASQIAIGGLFEVLKNSSRYEVIRTSEAFIGSGPENKFPEPLDWATIEELCSKYKVDAIIALETFDSDFIITNGRIDLNKLSEMSSPFYAQGVATVKLGFRMYDPQEKSIIDQFHFSESANWEAGGASILNAVDQLINKDAAIKEVSHFGGSIYGERITPTWYKVSREYFRKSKKDDDLAEGARMMEANDWDRALEALLRAEKNGHKKTKGKAAHNLAVVYEILGDLEKANDWAATAWGKYKNKGSKDYGYILTRRIKEQKYLQQQLNN